MTGRQRGMAAFKAVVYTLLAVNILVFFLASDALVPHKAVDQVGWCILLAVFEWETRIPGGGVHPARFGRWPLVFEAGGYACALYALGHYLAEPDWLEVTNASAWLAISALIWMDILRPDGGRALLRGWLRTGLYALTFICAVIWGVEGKLLDFYDAALWILCFFVIELNILGLEHPGLRPRPR